MADKKDTILVTGVTGQQGGAVARELLRNKWPVVGLTRHPEKTQQLNLPGVKFITADMTNRDSLNRALTGIHKAFLMTMPFEFGAENEVEQGVKFIDACAIAGVEHLVFSSVGSAQRNTGIPHFESKWKIEEHLRRTGVPHTIIRPVWFMENFGASWVLPMLQKGTLYTPLRADCPLQQVAVEDVGKFVAAAFEHPDQYLGKEIDIAGDELTMPKSLEMINSLTDRHINYVTQPESEAEAAWGHDFAVMFKWFNDVGYNVNIDQLEKQYKIKLTRFKDWVKDSAVVKELKAEAPVH